MDDEITHLHLQIVLVIEYLSILDHINTKVALQTKAQ